MVRLAGSLSLQRLTPQRSGRAPFAVDHVGQCSCSTACFARGASAPTRHSRCTTAHRGAAFTTVKPIAETPCPHCRRRSRLSPRRNQSPPQRAKSAPTSLEGEQPVCPIAHSLPAEVTTGKAITVVTSVDVGHYRAAYRCPTDQRPARGLPTGLAALRARYVFFLLRLPRRRVPLRESPACTWLHASRVGSMLRVHSACSGLLACSRVWHLTGGQIILSCFLRAFLDAQVSRADRNARAAACSCFCRLSLAFAHGFARARAYLGWGCCLGSAHRAAPRAALGDYKNAQWSLRGGRRGAVRRVLPVCPTVILPFFTTLPPSTHALPP